MSRTTNHSAPAVAIGPMTDDEREFLNLVALLKPDDRAALRRVMKALTSRAGSSTIN